MISNVAIFNKVFGTNLPEVSDNRFSKIVEEVVREAEKRVEECEGSWKTFTDVDMKSLTLEECLENLRKHVNDYCDSPNANALPDFMTVFKYRCPACHEHCEDLRPSVGIPLFIQEEMEEIINVFKLDKITIHLFKESRISPFTVSYIDVFVSYIDVLPDDRDDEEV